MCVLRPAVGRVFVSVFFLLMAVGVNVVLVLVTPGQFVLNQSEEQPSHVVGSCFWSTENRLAGALLAALGIADLKQYLRLRISFHEFLVEQTIPEAHRGPVAADVRSEAARILRHRLTSYRGFQGPLYTLWGALSKALRPALRNVSIRASVHFA